MTTRRIDTVISATIAIAAIAIAAAVVYRTVTAARQGINSPVSERASIEPIEGWERAREIGIRLFGDATAPVTIVEFADLECPACRMYHDVLASLARSDSAHVQVIYVHYPLPMHRFAVPAARAMECADSVGHARGWLEIMYESQDSLGLLGWGALADRAGISDTLTIAQCAMGSAKFARVEAGMRLGRRHGVDGGVWLLRRDSSGAATFARFAISDDSTAPGK